MAQLTLLPGMDRFNRVLCCRETFLTEIIREALSLGRFEPAVTASLAADIDRAAKEAKKIRLMDALWREEALPRFPSFEEIFEPADFDSVDAETFTLEAGRPRVISAEVLLVLVVVDGVYSLSSFDGYERLVGSEVFRAVLGEGRRTPSRSTIAKYLELVSAESHTLLHRAVCRKVRAEGLDTFEELTVDSTAIEANTAWPTESALIYGFLSRIHRLLERQEKYTHVAYGSKLVERWLNELSRLHRSLSMLPARPDSVAKRRKLYGRLLTVAGKTRRKLDRLFSDRWEPMSFCCIRPTFRLRVDRMLKQIETDFAEVDKAVEAARRRVLQGECVPASEKVFSLADPDAYMIVKGQRNPVVGYKPQLGRSGNGFISCFEVLRGNPADSERLAPMLAAHIEATGTCPAAVSTDDGYSSTPNLESLVEAGVEVISFSGAKGRDVLGDELYELDTLALLRSERSAVESLIFTFKHKFGMRRFCRRGLTGARKDLSAAVLAYNLWRIAFVRKTMRRESDDPPSRVVA